MKTLITLTALLAAPFAQAASITCENPEQLQTLHFEEDSGETPTVTFYEGRYLAHFTVEPKDGLLPEPKFPSKLPPPPANTELYALFDGQGEAGTLEIKESWSEEGLQPNWKFCGRAGCDFPKNPPKVTKHISAWIQFKGESVHFPNCHENSAL